MSINTNKSTILTKGYAALICATIAFVLLFVPDEISVNLVVLAIICSSCALYCIFSIICNLDNVNYSSDSDAPTTANLSESDVHASIITDWSDPEHSDSSSITINESESDTQTVIDCSESESDAPTINDQSESEYFDMWPEYFDMWSDITADSDPSSESDEKSREIVAGPLQLGKNVNNTCGICEENAWQIVLGCGHPMCSVCLNKILADNKLCPYDRISIEKDRIVPIFV